MTATGDEELLAVAAAVRSGQSSQQAWASVGVVCDSDGVPPAGMVDPAVRAAARLSAELGAPPATLLETCARSLERDRALEARRRAAMAAPSATARLLLALPLIGPVLGGVLGVDTTVVLLSGPGLLLLAAGGALLGVGHLWVRREVAVAEAAGRAP